jgi:uncharacterized protein (TIGR03435 family)
LQAANPPTTVKSAEGTVQQAGRGRPLKTDANAPSLLTAFRDQLGLKVDSAKPPVEVLVIDFAEQPKAN